MGWTFKDLLRLFFFFWVCRLKASAASSHYGAYAKAQQIGWLFGWLVGHGNCGRFHREPLVMAGGHNLRSLDTGRWCQTATAQCEWMRGKEVKRITKMYNKMVMRLVILVSLVNLGSLEPLLPASHLPEAKTLVEFEIVWHQAGVHGQDEAFR